MGATELGYAEMLETNVTQIASLPYFLILLLIFPFRFLLYALLFQLRGKIKPFEDIPLFYTLFVKSHLYQWLGFLTLGIWLMELEGNIIGFIVAPLSVLLGALVAIISFVRIVMIPGKWQKIKAAQQDTVGKVA